MGENLTHVFFQKGTKIQSFEMYCFDGNDMDPSASKLKYVEFPDSLLSIGDFAFRRCGGLDYSVVTDNPDKMATAVITGANINNIGATCFQQAFKEKTIPTLRIGSKVTNIGQYAFRNDNLKYSNILIGQPNDLSLLVFPDLNTNPRFNETGVTVDFYSEKYSASDATRLAVYFEGVGALNIT